MHILALMVLLIVPVALAVLVMRGVRSFFGLVHPAWTHAPAVGMLFAVVLYAAIAGAAGRWPVFYVNSVNQLPTAWQFVLRVVPVSLVMIAISVLLDELWARQEPRKTFNWMSLLDEAAVGLVVGSSLANLSPWHSMGAHTAAYVMDSTGFTVGLVFALVLVLFAILLEFRRPYEPQEDHVVGEDTTALAEEFTRRAKSGEHFSYWESQNPVWQTALVIIVSAFFVFGAVMAWKESPWTSFLLVILAPLPFLVYGGLRVSVTTEGVDARLGLLGIHLLSLPIRDIAEAEVHKFAPLHDFGGYGIRGNRQMKAYFFRGNRGVRIKTGQGKQYLIGSDHPERLAAAIRAARGE